jgi:hypothetical protein
MSAVGRNQKSRKDSEKMVMSSNGHGDQKSGRSIGR